MKLCRYSLHQPRTHRSPHSPVQFVPLCMDRPAADKRNQRFALMTNRFFSMERPRSPYRCLWNTRNVKSKSILFINLFENEMQSCATYRFCCYHPCYLHHRCHHCHRHHLQPRVVHLTIQLPPETYLKVLAGLYNLSRVMLRIWSIENLDSNRAPPAETFYFLIELTFSLWLAASVLLINRLLIETIINQQFRVASVK